MFLSLCACFYGFHSDMESGIFTWKEIHLRPIEMSLKQKIQSMSGSLFPKCTWLLKRPSSPFCAYFLSITKFAILESTVIILNQLSQWQLHISRWCLLNWINIPARAAQITSFVMRRRNVQTGLDSLFKRLDKDVTGGIPVV